MYEREHNNLLAETWKKGYDEGRESVLKKEPVAYFAKDRFGYWGQTDKESGIPFYIKEDQDEL